MIERGLVDALGGLSTAVALAKERAKIDASTEVELVVYPPARSFYELLSEQLAGGTAQSAIHSWLSASLSSVEIESLRAMRPLSLFRTGEPLALMPVRLLR